MTIRQILLILRLRWWLVLSLLAVVLVSGYFVTRKLPKRYLASTTIILDLKTDPLLAALAPAMAAPSYIATQAEILQSERLSGRVVRMMGLAQSPAAVAQWREETDAKMPLETYFGQTLQRGLQVQQGRGSQILTINYVGTDPNFAAAAANTFARAYIDLSVELRTGPARENAGYFDERIKLLRTELEAAQAKVAAFQQSKGVVISSDRYDQESARLQSLEAAYAAALAEQASTSSVARNSGGDASMDVAQSGAVQGLRSQIATAETRLAEASLTLGPSHPTRIQLEAQIRELKDQLASETRHVSKTSTSVNRVVSQRMAELRSLVDAQKRTVLNMRAVRDEGSLLMKDLEAAQRAFEAVNLRRSQLSLESQADQAGARVLSPATAPLEPTSPNLPKNMAISGIVGLLLGLAAAFGWELLDRRVRSEDDLQVADGIPVLSVLSSKRGTPHFVRQPPPLPRTPPQLTMNNRSA